MLASPLFSTGSPLQQLPAAAIAAAAAGGYGHHMPYGGGLLPFGAHGYLAGHHHHSNVFSSALISNPPLLSPLAAATNAFEGVPIFLVPQSASGGPPSVPLAALQRVSEMRINWARQPSSNQPKIDTSRHFHVFVGDLSPEIDNKTLIDAFATYGEVSDGKVIRDMQTLKSKGYGFVSFVKKEDAQNAIDTMNGQWLGKRVIRTNWAARKPNAPPATQLEGASFEEVFNATTPTNASVYIGNITAETSEEDLREAFGRFGTIEDVRVLGTLGYAFIRFETKESATQAICEMNATELGGQTIRCSWGRPNYDGSSGSTSSTSSVQNYSPNLTAVNGATMIVPGAGTGLVGPGGIPTVLNNTLQQQYWNVYQQYYNNPQLLAQWQSYWQQMQQQS